MDSCLYNANKYVLSICIPTFSRAEDLSQTLSGIIEQDGFADDIEIVVVDNASTDDTAKVVSRYSGRNSNIKYVQNDHNIGPDRNILKAALSGSGKYVKLLNDNKLLKDGVITHWRDIYASSSEAVIFNYPNAMNLPQWSSKVYTVDQFLRNVSYYITWLGGISFKREAIQDLTLSDLKDDSFLIQTEMLLKLLCKYGEGRVIYSDWFSETRIPKRSGYNYFEVFANNFVVLLDEIELKGFVTHSTKQTIKSELLRDHTFPFIIQSLLHHENNSQKRDGALYYLLKNFSTCLELYLFPLWAIRRAATKIMKYRIPKAHF